MQSSRRHVGVTLTRKARLRSQFSATLGLSELFGELSGSPSAPGDPVWIKKSIRYTENSMQKISCACPPLKKARKGRLGTLY